jgi:hypothetical protein
VFGQIFDNECAMMSLQCDSKASPPVEATIDMEDDRADSKFDGFVWNLLEKDNDFWKNGNSISECDLFSDMSHDDSGNIDDQSAEYNLFSDMSVNDSGNNDNNVIQYDLFLDMSE